MNEKQRNIKIIITFINIIFKNFGWLLSKLSYLTWMNHIINAKLVFSINIQSLPFCILNKLFTLKNSFHLNYLFNLLTSVEIRNLSVMLVFSKILNAILRDLYPVSLFELNLNQFAVCDQIHLENAAITLNHWNFNVINLRFYNLLYEVCGTRCSSSSGCINNLQFWLWTFSHCFIL